VSYSISTLLTRNLHDVFGENTPVHGALRPGMWPPVSLVRGATSATYRRRMRCFDD
jgi:hypothetical protein